MHMHTHACAFTPTHTHTHLPVSKPLPGHCTCRGPEWESWCYHSLCLSGISRSSKLLKQPCSGLAVRSLQVKQREGEHFPRDPQQGHFPNLCSQRIIKRGRHEGDLLQAEWLLGSCKRSRRPGSQWELGRDLGVHLQPQGWILRSQLCSEAVWQAYKHRFRSKARGRPDIFPIFKEL